MSVCVECAGSLPYAGEPSVCSDDCARKFAADHQLAGNTLRYYLHYGICEVMHVEVLGVGSYVLCQHNLNKESVLRWFPRLDLPK